MSPVSLGARSAEQEKIVKFSTLLTNCVVFYTTVGMMAVLRDLIPEGLDDPAGDLAVLSTSAWASAWAWPAPAPSRTPAPSEQEGDH
jgi:Tn3 transposase DDE domain